MGYYCMGPAHVNDEVDAAIMSRNTVKGSNSWESLSHPRHVAEKEVPWESTIDANGRGVAGQEAMDNWAAPKPILEYVLRKGETRLTELLMGQYRMINSNVQVPLGKVGEYLSRNANLEQLLKKTLFDEVHGLNPLTAAWIKYLAENGYDDGPPITEIGTEHMHAEARIWYRTAITASKYLKEWAEAHTEELGIDDYEGRLAYKIYTMLHEIGHNRGVMSESKLGILLKEFYERMAKKCEGTDKGRVYKALAKEAAEYAKSYSSRFLEYFSDYSNLSREEVAALVGEYMAQGEGEGYRGKALSDYVARKLNKASEKDQEDDDSPEDSKNSKGKKAKSAKKSEDNPKEDTGDTKDDGDAETADDGGDAETGDSD